MSSFVQFLLLGVGPGAIFAILGLGLVLIYRGSGTINFAQGAFALFGAYLVYQLDQQQGLPLAAAMILACAIVGLVGVLTQILFMRPLRGKSPLARVIATLGVMTVIQQAIVLKYGSTQLRVESPLPEEPIHIGSSIIVGQQNFWLVGIAVALTLLLSVVSRRTRVGLAVSAAAENQTAASALGFSPDLLACLTWGAGGITAGIAGVFFAATTSNFLSSGGGLALVIVGALAAALLGGFRSFPLVLAGGLLIGIAQAECQNYVTTTGVADAVPFLFIVVVLVIRGRGLPVRGSVAERLPRVGSGRVHPLFVAAATVVFAALALTVFKDTWNVALIASITTGIVILSVVLVTGYAGQLSLAQFALGGVGGFAAGRLVAGHGWPFLGALVVGVVCAVAVGLLFGLPALRTRGVNLAVVTFGLGFAVWSLVFNNGNYTGRERGTVIGPQRIFGISIDPVTHSGRYTTVCAIVLAGCTLALANLRRGRSGRRLLAVRANERAAASLGISIVGAKLYAFGLGAGIAGLGGVLFAFSYHSITYSTLFDPFTSVSVMTFAVVGGIGYLSSSVWGSLLVPAGITGYAISNAFSSINNWLPLIGGILLLLTLLGSPDGIAANVNDLAGRVLPRTRRSPAVSAAKSRRRTERVPPLTLRVEDVTVAFGGVVAVQNVSLSVGPGEVVGLIGPNGAGKTTLVDAMTGYARARTGSVRLGERDITRWQPHRRAQAGLARSFQALELFADLSVRENLLAACETRDAMSYFRDLAHPGRPALTALAESAVDEMQLNEVLDQEIDSLSFGQRRLVAIARSVAMGGSILLLDEPGAGLDENETAELGRLIRRLADDWGIGILLIEHDVAMVLRTADRVVVLESGSVIASGAPDEIRTDPGVVLAYLGQEATSDNEQLSQVPISSGGER